MKSLPTAVSNLGKQKLIVRLQKADGNEEIAGLQSKHGVEAIVLMHSIPHLSHLSIRAKQEKLPFVAVVNHTSEFAQISNNLIGENVDLLFKPEGAEIRISTTTTSWSDLRNSVCKSFESDKKESLMHLEYDDKRPYSKQ